MEKAAATCATAAVVQLLLGLFGDKVFLISGVVTLVFAGLLGILAISQKR